MAQREYPSHMLANQLLDLESCAHGVLALVIALLIAALIRGRRRNRDGHSASLVDRTAYGQEHNVSVTSTSEDRSYRLSLGYLDQNGIIRASSTQRLSLGANYQQRMFGDRLSVRASLRGSRTLDHFTPGDVLGNAAAMAPTQPVLDPSSATGYWDWNTSAASPSNPVASLNLAKDHGTTWRSVGNAQVEYRLPFLDGLAANVNLGYDATKTDRVTFTPNNLAAQVKQGQGSFSLSNNTQATSLLDAYLHYAPARAYGPGTVDVVGGYSYSQSHAEYPNITETKLTSNLLQDNGVPPAVNRTLTTAPRVASFSDSSRLALANISPRRGGLNQYGPSTGRSLSAHSKPRARKRTPCSSASASSSPTPPTSCAHR